MAQTTHTSKEIVRQAHTLYKKEAYREAAEAFAQAAQAFKAAGDSLSAAEMQNNSSVAYLRAGEAQKAFELAAGTESIFEAAGDIRRQAMAIGNRAAALDELGQSEEAEKAYLLAAELLETAGEDELRAHVMQSLSALQLRKGRHLEALASMQDGVEAIKKPSLKQRWLKRLLRLPFDFLNKKS